MSLYIPKMSDTPGVTIPGLADNFNLLAGSRIVESGSNENGEYWRWENGLQVCVKQNYTPDANLPVDQQIGQLYRSAFRSWSLPAAFNADQYFASGCYTSQAESRYLWFTGIGEASFWTDKVCYTWLSPRSTTTGDIGPTLFAIGRWK